LQGPVSAAWACFDIDARQGEHRSFASAGEEAEVTDPHESCWQHVQTESPDELRCLQGHDLDPVMVASIPILEPDRPVVDRKDAAIADGHAVGRAAEILKRSLPSVERRFVGTSNAWGNGLLATFAGVSKK